MDVILFMISCFFVLMPNIYWYRIKYILSKNGDRTYIFWHSFDEFVKFKRLIYSIEDERLAMKYKRILNTLYLSIVISIITLIISIILSFVSVDGLFYRDAIPPIS